MLKYICTFSFLLQDKNSCHHFRVHVFISGNVWEGPTSNIWTDEQCDNIRNMDISNNFEACQSACQEDENCSAINFKTTGGCTLRACPYPVPVPIDTLSDFVGYYKLSGIKICIRLVEKC